MADIKNVAVLGVTGSIGSSATIELLENPHKFRTVAVAANKSIDKLAQTAKLLGADTAVTGDPSLEPVLARALDGSGISCGAGEAELVRIAERDDVDILLCAIIGVAGIRPVISALRCGKTVALASKEVLCLAGELVMEEARKSPGGKIVPVDSEHSGVFQCLAGRRPDEISKIWLTASGGPFRLRRACPTWRVSCARCAPTCGWPSPRWKRWRATTPTS